MSDLEQLRQTFSDSLGDFAASFRGTSLEKKDPLEIYLSELVLYELSANQNLYDQRRYDLLFEGLNKIFGWTRVQLHQNILEFKSLLKSSPNPTKSIRDGLSRQSRQILLQICDEVILGECADPAFKTYFLGKINLMLE